MDIQSINAVLTKAISLFQADEIDSLTSIHEMAARKHPHAKTVKQAIQLDKIDPMVAKNIVMSGLKDGSVKDDKVKVAKKSWPAAALKPSQSTMVLDKAL